VYCSLNAVETDAATMLMRCWSPVVWMWFAVPMLVSSSNMLMVCGLLLAWPGGGGVIPCAVIVAVYAVVVGAGVGWLRLGGGSCGVGWSGGGYGHM